MGAFDLNLCHDLDLEFSRSNIELGISRLKMVQLPGNKKTNIFIEFQASNVTLRLDFGHDLDPEFSRSNMEFAMLKPKYLIAMKSRSHGILHRLDSFHTINPGSSC